MTWLLKPFKTIASLAICLAGVTALHAQDKVSAPSSLSPEGYWENIDDASQKPEGIVRIFVKPDHTLTGIVTKVYPQKGLDENNVCRQCKGAYHDKKIEGTTIFWDLKQKDANKIDYWDGGQIIDPKTGKVYRLNLRVVNGGKQIHARGYIGISLFGRTQTWNKVNPAN